MERFINAEARTTMSI